MKRMKVIPLALALTALLASTVLTNEGCALPAAVAGRSTSRLTTPGIDALHARQVGRGLDVIRDFAVEAEATKNMSTATMLKVVRWHKDAALTIDQSPGGWRPVVLAGLVQLKNELTPGELLLIGPYIDASILVIKAVT